MSETAVKTYADFQLPPSVVGKLDVSRIVSEFEQVDNEMTTAAVRAKAGSQSDAQLKLSDELTDFLTLNELRPSTSNERTELIKQLRLLKDSVPVLHMTFAVEADRDSLQYLVQWVRGYLHPQTVLEIGLQPSLIAGVYLRTPNQVRDYSMRGLLKGGHKVLVGELEKLRGSK